MTCYTSEQDGAILPAWDCPLCSRKIFFWPYNKCFIDKACSVKMAGYWHCTLTDIMPCRPHACPITQMYYTLLGILHRHEYIDDDDEDDNDDASIDDDDVDVDVDDDDDADG